MSRTTRAVAVVRFPGAGQNARGLLAERYDRQGGCQGRHMARYTLRWNDGTAG